LEETVKEFLTAHRFLTDEATYHSVMQPEISLRLSRIYTPTALYVRGRADRIAVHKEQDIVFEWEAKTWYESRKHNMALEALPICHHLVSAELGVKCLYAYRDSKCGYDVGFWIHELPPVQVIFIPGRWDSQMIEWFKNQFRMIFPLVETRQIEVKRGSSGDPFIIVNEEDVKKLPDWRDLIRELLQDTKSLGEGEY